MKSGTTFFLKGTIFLIGTPVLFLCIWFVPALAEFSTVLYPEMPFMQYLIGIDLYGAAVFYVIALYQAFRLLTYIDRSDAFSGAPVQALKVIKRCAAAISLLFAAGMPMYYLIAQKDDAPGMILMGLMIVFASGVIAVFAAVLQKLLHEAIVLKSENDLTV